MPQQHHATMLGASPREQGTRPWHWLERALDARDQTVWAFIRIDRFLDPLRDVPGFQTVTSRLEALEASGAGRERLLEL